MIFRIRKGNWNAGSLPCLAVTVMVWDFSYSDCFAFPRSVLPRQFFCGYRENCVLLREELRVCLPVGADGTPVPFLSCHKNRSYQFLKAFSSRSVSGARFFYPSYQTSWCPYETENPSSHRARWTRWAKERNGVSTCIFLRMLGSRLCEHTIHLKKQNTVQSVRKPAM